MLKLGIVGFGAVCENAHAAVIKKLSDEFNPVCVFDISKERREKAKDILGVREYDDLESMFEKEDLDAVTITTPPNSHKDIIIKALNKGVNVICEKPLCRNISEFREIEEAVKKTGKTVYTVHNWVYSPHIIKISEFMKEIGKVWHIKWETLRKKPSQTASSNWRIDPDTAGGGIIFDHGWHVIYIIGSFLNKNITDINSFFVFNDNKIDEIADFRMAYGEVSADIHLSWRSPIRKNFMSAYGDKGVLVFEDDYLKVIFENGEFREHKFAEKLSGSSAHPIWTENVYKDFYNSLKDRRKFDENFNQSRECIYTIERAYESYKRG